MNMGLDKGKVTVIIPTLNEAEGILDVIKELKNSGYTNLLVVDGGSVDGTVELVRKTGVRLVMQEGKGKADAIKTGLSYVTTPYLLIIDGDATYPADQADRLLEKILEGYDEVLGARRYSSKSQSIIYRIGNRVLTSFFNLLMGTRLSDVLTGMYMIRTDIIKEVTFEMTGFSVESEIAAHVAATSQKITEVPVNYRERKGKKKLGIMHGFMIAKDMVRLAWRYNPVFSIFFSGSLLLLVGLGLAIHVLYELTVNGVLHSLRGLLALTLSLFGFQSLLLAIFSLYMRRFEYRITRKLEYLNRLISRGHERENRDR